MPRRFVTTIELKGPFFTHDPKKTFRQNARVMLEELSQEGAADVIAQLLQGQPSRAEVSNDVQPARVSGHVVGRVTSLSGHPWAVTAKVSVLNRGLSARQAKALMAAASRIEGRDHVFRRTTGRMRRARAVNRAELLKGLQ